MHYFKLNCVVDARFQVIFICFFLLTYLGNDIGLEYPISSLTDTARMGDKYHVINFDDESICIKFKTKADAQKLRLVLDNIRRLHPKSVFSERTEESSASQYFQFYGYLSQQQNMMQDYVRTSTYQKAILSNISDFQVNFDANVQTKKNRLPKLK